MAASEAAAISRVTWHRLEKGEMTVAWGSVLAATAVLVMRFRLTRTRVASQSGRTAMSDLQDWLRRCMQALSITLPPAAIQQKLRSLARRLASAAEATD